MSNFAILEVDTVYIEKFSLKSGKVESGEYTYAQVWNALPKKPFPMERLEEVLSQLMKWT